jgi:hypothetical protein
VRRSAGQPGGRGAAGQLFFCLVEAFFEGSDLFAEGLRRLTLLLDRGQKLFFFLLALAELAGWGRAADRRGNSRQPQRLPSPLDGPPGPHDSTPFEPPGA